MSGIDPAASIHPHALVDEGARVGAGTRVWAFAHILSGAVVGSDCNVCDHTFVEGRVSIGDRVTLKCGVYLWNGITVEDDVFIGPNATVTNDVRPRSRHYLAKHLEIVLRQGCSIGANATVLPGVSVGAWSMVAAGAVVTRDVAAHALVVGCPAEFRCWVCRCGEKLIFGSDNRARCQCSLSYNQFDGKIQLIP